MSTVRLEGLHTRLTVASILLLSAPGLSAQITPSHDATCGVAGSMGPLTVRPNLRYFMAGKQTAVFLAGSHTWNAFQDMGTSTSPAAFDFDSYVQFLKAHGHNATILWKKDLPTDCGWGAGGIWHFTQFPWRRTGGPDRQKMAADGLPAFDLSQFDQAYFDRLRARAVRLQQNGIYAIVQLFDSAQLIANRCRNDGYPFTGVNNVNGVDDGYTGGASGTKSFTMTANNTISQFQDAYAEKVIDTLNDLPNVLWEISEEAPFESTWWQGHMIGLIRAYEGGGAWEGTTYSPKPLRHPVGLGGLQYPGKDSFIYGTSADWIAPSLTYNADFPAVVSLNNQGHVVINDSDHALYFTHFLDANGNVMNQRVRNYIWENFTSGSSVLFMDPYDINWPGSQRNVCSNAVNGLCSAPDPKYNNLRDNLGYTLSYAKRLNLAQAQPQGSLASTGYCLANPASTNAEYLVYAPSDGTFTVDLSATTNTLKVEWFNPSSGTAISAGTVSGGTAAQRFTAPFSGDAVLYLADSGLRVPRCQP